VAVASAAAADLLGDGEAGVTTPEDLPAFAGTVADLWGQPERRRAMAAAGRRIAAGYAPEACASTMLDHYRDVIGARQTAPVRATAVRPREA
jgi:glycosyltransferase involved in cell wall biosynthesis